jgi:oligopeptide transport system substrate-binding protein
MGARGRKRRRRSLFAAITLAATTILVAASARTEAPRAKYFGRVEPPADDVLRFANGAEPELLDPGLMSGQPDGRIARALFEGLVTPHPRTLAPTPGMASRWEISPEGLRYTFHLRSNARWTNGDRVTAHDFRWSWLRVLSPKTAARYADIFYCIRNAKPYKQGTLQDAAHVGVHAMDDTTLVVDLEAPTPYFMQLVMYYPFLPVHRATVEKYGERWTHVDHIVGNGAFKLTFHRQNDRFVMDRNQDYWDVANVRLRRIIAYSVDDLTTMLNMYRAGMTDWNPSGYLPAQYIPFVRDYEDYHSGPYLGTYFYSFNVTQPPFDDARVRRALALAVDRERIVKYLLHDSRSPWGNVVSPGFEGYPYPEGVRFDPAAARALLAAAGYPAGRGFPAVELLFNTSQDHRKIAEAIQEMWRQHLGIEVQLANQEWGSYMQNTTRLQYQVARRSWIADYLDPNTFLFMLRSGDGNNRTGWSDARFDSLIALAGRTLEEPARFAIMAQAERIALDAMPYLPIYGYSTVELLAPYVRGFYSTPLDVHPLKHLYFEHGDEARGAGGAAAGAEPRSAP